MNTPVKYAVMETFTELSIGSHKYSILGVDEPTHLHINNFNTNKNSVIVSIDDLEQVLGKVKVKL